MSGYVLRAWNIVVRLLRDNTMIEFFAQHQLYIVLGVVLLIWAGIVGYLMRLDGRVRKLEESGK